MDKEEYLKGIKRAIEMAKDLHLGFSGMKPLAENDPYIHELEEVLAGRLIGVHDPDWTFEKAFPVIRIVNTDGWEFTVRGYDAGYQFQDHPDWIKAEMKEFQVKVLQDDSDDRPLHCLDCGADVYVEVVVFVTPSGRRFSEKFRSDTCKSSCRHGNGRLTEKKIRSMAPKWRTVKALKLLSGYVSPEKFRTLTSESEIFDPNVKERGYSRLLNVILEIEKELSLK
ncbi:MAG: hypothetical protein WAV73_01595 [Candidatus Moraniibacteriota bacterium]